MFVKRLFFLFTPSCLLLPQNEVNAISYVKEKWTYNVRHIAKYIYFFNEFFI